MAPHDRARVGEGLHQILQQKLRNRCKTPLHELSGTPQPPDRAGSPCPAGVPSKLLAKCLGKGVADALCQPPLRAIAEGGIERQREEEARQFGVLVKD